MYYIHNDRHPQKSHPNYSDTKNTPVSVSVPAAAPVSAPANQPISTHIPPIFVPVSLPVTREAEPAAQMAVTAPVSEVAAPPIHMHSDTNREDIINTFRRLWFEHVLWTRSVITSTAANNPDLAETTARLLRNPADFAEALLPFYSEEKTDTFKKLFTEHLTIAGDLLGAHKAHDINKALAIRDKWYKNADEIAAALAFINPNWNKNEWKKLMDGHLAMTEEEMLLRLDGNYRADIKEFDMIEREALKMADTMSYGLIKQFKII